MTTETFTILAGRAGDAAERLAKIAKKAKRYGVPFAVEFGEVYIVEKTRTGVDWIEDTHNDIAGKPRKIKVEVIDVTITGETPKVGEYEFLASVELGEGGNFIDAVPGVDIPRHYREADGSCDHCGVERRRKHLFVVRETGTERHKIVGRTCLRDFLGTDDPKRIIKAFAFWKSFDGERDDEGGWGGFGSYPWCASLEFLLAATGALIRMYGWCSKTMAANDYSETLTPTVTRLWALWGTDKYSRREADAIRAEMRTSDDELARTVIDWVRASEDDNDYFHNLRLAFRDDLLGDDRRVGLAISAVAAYHRHIEREIKRAERAKLDKGSVFVGEKGERLRGLDVVLETSRSIGDNGWGETLLLKFRRDDGALFTWFTTSAPRLDVGEAVTIDGTVKKHNEFKGTKENLLTRVSVK